MKCNILHETPGRMRVHLALRRMSLREADLLEYDLKGVAGVVSVKVFDRTQDAVITCAGDYTADAYTLLWFIIQNQDMTLYRAVDCRVLNNGSYWMKKTYTPSACARDIVHVVWRYARDIVLINNFDCRSIVYHTSYGDEKTELSAEDIPYVFPYAPPYGTTGCDFLDAAGNSIR